MMAKMTIATTATKMRKLVVKDRSRKKRGLFDIIKKIKMNKPLPFDSSKLKFAGVEEIEDFDDEEKEKKKYKKLKHNLSLFQSLFQPCNFP